MEETKVVENKSATSKKKNSGEGFGSKITAFFTGVKAEFGKIIWPTKNDMIKQTTAVIVVSVICCALIAVLDYAFSEGISFLISIAK